MKATTKKRGSSAAVPIPPAVTPAAHLHLDEGVDVRENEPVRQKKYALDDLLKGITAQESA